MKRILLLSVAALSVFTGCVSELFSDDELKQRVDGLEERVVKLEEWCQRMNDDIETIRAIVEAIQESDYITSVNPIKEGGKEIGYVINFYKGKSITVYHGKDGTDGKDGRTPVIGVRQHTDGVYYWTLDGEWLLDGSGNKVKAGGADGKDGVTPQFKIENENWYVSYDGSSWSWLGRATGGSGSTGSAGDSIFKQVRQDDNNVYFVLNDGIELVVPKSAPLTVSFNSADLVVMEPNSTRKIQYSVTSSSDNIELEVVPSGDIKAEVVAESAKSGYISVTTSDSIDKYSKVVVLVSDGAKVVMKSLKFEAEAIKVEGPEDQNMSYGGGTVNLYYLSNVDCEVLIPESVNWLHVIGTKALQEHYVTLLVDRNSGMPRTANVIVRSESGLQLVYTVSQECSPEYKTQAEREALMEFFNSTGGWKWTRNDNWGSDRDISEWYGVYVTENSGGRYIDISLSNNGLNGPVPDSFWDNLPLRIADLSSNSLNGILNFGKIANVLEKRGGWIDVSSNWFECEITPEFAPCQDRMYIYGNNIYGDIPVEVTSHDLWWQCWMNVYYQYVASNGRTINTEGVVIPGPPFAVDDIYGGSISLPSEYAKNKLTVLFSWSMSSSTIMDTMKYNYEEYKEQGVNFISWNPYDDEATIKNYLSANNVPWSNMAANLHFYMLRWNPTILVVDNKGELVYQNLTSGEEAFDFIDKYLTGGKEYKSVDYSQDKLVYTLQKATQGNGIDIVLMGDGYSDRMIASGKYRQVMEEAMEYLFVEEPYKSFRNLFNVYMVNAVSETEVIGGPTVFNTRFGEGTYVEGDNDKVFSYTMNAVSPDRMDEVLVVVMQNSRKYAGTCWMYYPSEGDYGNGPSISYFPVGTDGQAFQETLNHETCGHGFAKLADEYAYESYGAIPQDERANREYWTQYGWFRNVDFTSNPYQVKWNRFLSDSRYANQGLGVFEGGLTYWSGVWRPTEYSIMRYNTGGFNAPSREAIYNRIHKLAYGESWQYNYEDFVRYDVINRSSNAVARNKAKAAQSDMENFEPLAPPVIVGKTWREEMND